MLQRFSRLLKTVAEKIYISPIILAFLFFLVVALAVTYPFVTSPKHTLTAPLASDTTSSVIQYEAFVREGLNPFTSTEYRLVGQPDGIPIAPGVNRVSFLSVLLLWVNSSLFGAITAHSLQTVTGFLLTAFITFLFVRSVTKSSAAGVVGGLIYGFWPQILGLGRAAPTYTHMWLFILPLWAFWSLAANGLSKRRVVLAALSVVPAIFWTPYYAFHILLVGGTCLGIASLVLYKNAGLKKTALLIFVVLGSWFIAYGAYIVVGMTAPASEVPVRTIEEAYQQSAHPLMYLLPGEYTHWGSALNTA
ncbi:MAG TPA: hypothetical protein VFM05_00590, partial [Candidatus Saccharimonadales bacterium]|nr:hypothetical protein [Candidatus Saccharimonadales bacterium]